MFSSPYFGQSEWKGYMARSVMHACGDDLPDGNGLMLSLTVLVGLLGYAALLGVDFSMFLPTGRRLQAEEYGARS